MGKRGVRSVAGTTVKGDKASVAPPASLAPAKGYRRARAKSAGPPKGEAGGAGGEGHSSSSRAAAKAIAVQRGKLGDVQQCVICKVKSTVPATVKLPQTLAKITSLRSFKSSQFVGNPSLNKQV